MQLVPRGKLDSRQSRFRFLLFHKSSFRSLESAKTRQPKRVRADVSLLDFSRPGPTVLRPVRVSLEWMRHWREQRPAVSSWSSDWIGSRGNQWRNGLREVSRAKPRRYLNCAPICCSLKLRQLSRQQPLVKVESTSSPGRPSRRRLHMSNRPLHRHGSPLTGSASRKARPPVHLSPIRHHPR